MSLYFLNSLLAHALQKPNNRVPQVLNVDKNINVNIVITYTLFNTQKRYFVFNVWPIRIYIVNFLYNQIHSSTNLDLVTIIVKIPYFSSEVNDINT